MRVEVVEQKRVYNGVYKLDRVVLRFEKFSGEMSEQLTRLVFERGDSAAVLLYDRQRDLVILVEQFRYPVYAREGAEGQLLEVVAGTVDRCRAPEAVARVELVEEAGYALEELEYMTTFYPSPGASTERIHLYLGYLVSATRVSPGGGTAGTGEDIRVHEVPFSKAWQWVRDGVIRDAKTIIALQWLALGVRGDRIGQLELPGE